MTAKKNLGSLFDDLDDGKPSPLTSVKTDIIETKDEIKPNPKEEIATTVDTVGNKDKNADSTNIILTEVNVALIEPETEITSNKAVETVEIIDEEKKQDEYNEKAIIYLKSKNYNNKKKYANFYLRESTLDMIDKLAGKGKGKSGYNKSELVDILLEEALGRLKIK